MNGMNADKNVTAAVFGTAHGRFGTRWGLCGGFSHFGLELRFKTGVLDGGIRVGDHVFGDLAA